jgi:serine/threonine protein kinase
LENTITSQALQNAPNALANALGELAGGAVGLDEVQALLTQEVEGNPSCGGAVQQFLEDEFSAERLTVENYAELMTSLQATLTEDVPTESVTDAPAQSGIYKIDDEGTLILSEEEFLGGANLVKPMQAFDSIGSPANKSVLHSDTGSAHQTGQQIPQEYSPPKVGYALGGRYRLDQEVARGSMGIVYRAMDLLEFDAGAKDPFVAIKLIGTNLTSHSDALRSFQNEIANTQHLSHPNIVNLFELDRDGDNYYITMEWLDGESLDALLDRSQGSALSPNQTYAIIEQLCDALIYAHERDVIHADIKPGNIFLVKTGEMKLIDWGIACAESGDGEGQSSAFAVALTPAYASCERLERSAPTAQDDLFSLACMIYRLISGRRVFGAMNALEAEEAGLEPVPIGGISAARWQAVRKAVSYRREDRQACVRDFADDFGQRADSREPEEEEIELSETMVLPKISEAMLQAEQPDDAANPSEVADDPMAAEPLMPIEEPDEIEPHDNFNFLPAEAPQLEEPSQQAEAPQQEEAPQQAEPPQQEEPTAMEANSQLSPLEMAAAEGDGADELADEPFPLTDPLMDAGPQGQADVNFAADDFAAPAAASAPAPVTQEESFAETVNLDAAPPLAVPAAEEAPFDETVNLGAAPALDAGEFKVADAADLEIMPEPINLFEGDGEGFSPVAGPAVTDSSPVDAPAPTPKAQQPEPKQAKTKQQPEAEPSKSAKATNQLRGGGQKQVITRPPTLKDRIEALAAEKPKVVARSLIGMVAVTISCVVILITAGVGLWSGFGTSQPVPVRAEVSQTAPLSRPVIVEPAPVGVPVQVDLTSSEQFAPVVVVPVGETPVIAVAQPNDVVTPVTLQTEGAIGIPVEEVVPRETLAAPVDDFLAVPVDVPIVETVSPLSELETVTDIVVTEAPAQTLEQTPQQQAAVTPDRGEYFLGMQNKTFSALSEGRLIEPDGDNAAFWIQRMREEGADIASIIEFEARLVAVFIGRAETAYIKGQLDEARHQVELAARYGAADDELAPLRSSIAKLSRSNVR